MEEKPRAEIQESNVTGPQKSQRVSKKKKSRIAANFATEAAFNGGNGPQ